MALNRPCSTARGGGPRPHSLRPAGADRVVELHRGPGGPAAQRRGQGARAELELAQRLVDAALLGIAPHEQSVGVLATGILLEDELRDCDAGTEALLGQVEGGEAIEYIEVGHPKGLSREQGP